MTIVMREIQLRLAAKAWLEQASRRSLRMTSKTSNRNSWLGKIAFPLIAKCAMNGAPRKWGQLEQRLKQMRTQIPFGDDNKRTGNGSYNDYINHDGNGNRNGNRKYGDPSLRSG
ncbi:hypothetical protein RBB75_08425 [Tunturibacter empetritectus]|uniref:Uncharacterized protein n=1 Tax=Tunturiibacter empetritectus TaxID=3069691 RepID=A0AAU7ZJ19_9BACT